MTGFLPIGALSFLDQHFSSVRQGLGTLLQSAGQFGYSPTTWDATPNQALEDFYRLDPLGNLDRILARIIPQAPAIKQAEAKLFGSQQMAVQALDNLRQQQAASLAYFDVFWVCAALGAGLALLVLLMKRSVAEKGAHVGAE